jgi:ribosomal protein S18 acetylase RimI-like enzyme
MSRNGSIQVRRVTDEASRQQALTVMRAIYRDEKNWVQADEKLIAADDLRRPEVSWFLVSEGDKPVGVLRVLYEPPLDLYKAYGFKVVAKDIDLDAFIRHNRIAEIGRFAILPEYRRNIRVAGALMNAASRDTIERGFTHYITDVFEGEQHSPYDFHTRVMGFQVVATHDTGELNCPCRRITLILDLKQGYRRLRAANNWAFRAITDGWPPSLHERLMADTPAPTTANRA